MVLYSRIMRQIHGRRNRGGGGGGGGQGGGGQLPPNILPTQKFQDYKNNDI